MRPNKANCQKNHFKNRLKERYGLTINNDGYNAIIRAIHTGEKQNVSFNGHNVAVVASFRAKQSNRLSVYALLLSNIEGEIPMIYDKERKTLVTTHPDLLKSHKNHED